MNGIRWVLLKIQSGHDSVHRRTDGQGETSIRGDKNCMLRVKILSLHVFFLKNEKDWLMLVSKAPLDIYIIHEVDTTLPILPYHRANIHCGLHFKTNRILEYSIYHTNTELWYGMEDMTRKSYGIETLSYQYIISHGNLLQCQKLRKIFTGVTYKLLLSFTVI